MSELFKAISDRRSGAPPRFRNLIAGEWVAADGSDLFEVRNPASGETIAEAPVATSEQIERAVATADQAAREGLAAEGFPPTRRLEVMEHARELLLDHADELAQTITEESGKPLAQSRKEVKTTGQRLRLTREEARALYGEYIPGEWVNDTEGKFAIVTRRPLGVVVALSPFNYPLFIGAAKWIPALLAGNAVVAKPASDTPRSLLMFARILQSAGVPDGMLSVLTGSGSQVGTPLVSDPRVAAITFTGSTAVGESIADQSGMKKLHLELGGKGAAIVLDDADLQLAAKEICKGALTLSGQRCDAISRVLVHGKVREPFVDALLQASEEYQLGDPSDEDTKLGPLINQDAADKVRGLVDDAVQQGARLLRGGDCDGLRFEPTILDQVDRESPIARKEIFGPVIPLITVADDADALQVARDSEFGLDSCVFTNSLNRAWDIANKLHDGTVSINTHPSHGVGHFPFGGNRRSGIGREGLKYSVDELTRLHCIVVATA